MLEPVCNLEGLLAVQLQYIFGCGVRVLVSESLIGCASAVRDVFFGSVPFDRGEVKGVATFVDNAREQHLPDVSAWLDVPRFAQIAGAFVLLEVSHKSAVNVREGWDVVCDVL